MKNHKKIVGAMIGSENNEVIINNFEILDVSNKDAESFSMYMKNFEKFINLINEDNTCSDIIRTFAVETIAAICHIQASKHLKQVTQKETKNIKTKETKLFH